MFYTYIHAYNIEYLNRRVFVMNLLTCAPNKASNQPAHTLSLIKVFVVRIKKLCTLDYPNTPNKF